MTDTPQTTAIPEARRRLRLEALERLAAEFAAFGVPPRRERPWSDGALALALEPGLGFEERCSRRGRLKVVR